MVGDVEHGCPNLCFASFLEEGYFCIEPIEMGPTEMGFLLALGKLLNPYF